MLHFFDGLSFKILPLLLGFWYLKLNTSHFDRFLLLPLLLSLLSPPSVIPLTCSPRILSLVDIALISLQGEG